MRLLLLEDDVMIGETVLDLLRAEQYAVDWVKDGDAADSALRAQQYDLVVLDLGVPRRDGLEVLRSLRARKQRMPVLIATARDSVQQRIEGLDAGADDYLVKPIAIPELAARLRAVLRRSQGRPEPVWTHGALEYRPAAKAARWQGTPVELTARECALLELLLAHPQRVLPRGLIQDKLYAFEQDIESNALEVHVHHLRRKIHPKIVRTVRGVGYALGGVEDLSA